MQQSSEKIYQNHGNSTVINCVPKNAVSILDIGCGYGDNARILEKEGRQIDGITLSNKEAENAKKYLSNVYIYNLENGLPPEINNKYDTVICSHVLEHIAYPDTLLKDIKNVLAPGGVLIVALPNLMVYQSRFKLLLGNFDYKETGIWDYTHLRWYTYKTGKELLLKHNFEVITNFVTGDIPFLTFTQIIPYSIRQFIYNNIFVKISKGLFGGQLIYVAKNK